MTDIEKVINGLSTCTNETPGCEPCPYRKLPEEQDCATALMKEALELLKKQKVQRFFVDENGKITPLPIVFPNCPLKEHEAVEPVLDEQTGRIWLCGNCGSYVGFEDNDPHDPNEFDKYCRKCGRPVLWEGR